MTTLGIEWEKVDTKVGGHSVVGERTIRLGKATASGKYARATLSATLVKEAGWKVGDRVVLYKQGTTLFMLKREASDLKFAKVGGQLVLNSVDLCTNLYPKINGELFDATYDSATDAVIFMPMKGR